MKQSTQERTKENFWNTDFKKSEVIWSVRTDHITSNFLKAVLHKIYLVNSVSNNQNKVAIFFTPLLPEIITFWMIKILKVALNVVSFKFSKKILLALWMILVALDGAMSLTWYHLALTEGSCQYAGRSAI